MLISEMENKEKQNWPFKLLRQSEKDHHFILFHLKTVFFDLSKEIKSISSSFAT